MSCAKCGDCCSVIILGFPTASLVGRSGPDVDFIMKHWTPLTPTEANERLPGIVQLIDEKDTRNHLYECDKWDRTTRLCTAHDERPPVCRGFPWYEGQPNDWTLTPFKRCSFWHDVPIEDWPEGVEPMETPPEEN